MIDIDFICHIRAGGTHPYTMLYALAADACLQGRGVYLDWAGLSSPFPLLLLLRYAVFFFSIELPYCCNVPRPLPAPLYACLLLHLSHTRRGD